MTQTLYQHAYLTTHYQPLAGVTPPRTEDTLVTLPVPLSQADLDAFLAQLPTRDVLAVQHGIPNIAPVSHPEETVGTDVHPWVHIHALTGVDTPPNIDKEAGHSLDFEPIMSSLIEQEPVSSYAAIRHHFLCERALTGLEQAEDSLVELNHPSLSGLQTNLVALREALEKPIE
jgi:hypothetical protein